MPLTVASPHHTDRAAAPAYTVSVTIRLSPDGPVVSRDSAAVLDLLRRLTERDGGSGPAVTGPADTPPNRAPQPITDHDAGLRIHPESRTVYRDADVVPLTRIEFDLLLFLAQNRRQVLTRRQLLSSVWGGIHVGERTVDVHVQRLRAKVGIGRPLVTTIRGVGYRLDDRAEVVLVQTQA
ncbi:winged helix-turn-helix domain-containing protein [Micromonospora sp. CPCC 206060]|uniref:winged helix-turn-helix domain-containing protein n=1 Tax=Micromonospora sp. CPCC 206060 TaxID=3122406 RepID=UPI002FF0BC5F